AGDDGGRWVAVRLAGSLVAAAFDRATPAPSWAGDFLLYLGERLDERLGERPGTARDVRRRQAGDGEKAPLELDPPPGMVLGPSPATRAFVDEARIAAGSRHDVLILGETGSGKELAARLLHRSGAGRDAPFLAINCAAIPAELLEAELFGVAARVATGVDPRPGLFLEAGEGTLLLDEIGELPPALQAKLLRVIQEREVLPLGASRPRPIAARLISTTNRDLAARVDDGRFRADLYYRLQKLELRVPPLRRRRDDLPALALAFAAGAAGEAGKRVRGLSRGALELLLAQPWPGNVRQLQTAVERAVLRCPDGGTLERRHFRDLVAPPPAQEPQPAVDGAGAGGASPLTLKAQLEAVERRAIRRALRRHRGHKARAAAELGISRQGLYLKLRRLGLDDDPARS
ncbi:MAG: hypothetical protein D6696_17560, partial [Acidobacteria bacterium]